jgi:hypothetical protein
MTTNSRRFTVEKRGTTEPGAIAWRVITSTDQIETIGNERVQVNFQPDRTYFWRATWGSLGFNLTIDEGVGGRSMYDYGKDYGGVYDPDPHVIFLGSPPSRSGADAQTAPGVVYRHLWVSSRPRPASANQ